MNKPTILALALILGSAIGSAEAVTVPTPMPVKGMNAVQLRTDCVYASRMYPAGYVMAKRDLRCHAGNEASHYTAFWQPVSTTK